MDDILKDDNHDFNDNDEDYIIVPHFYQQIHENTSLKSIPVDTFEAASVNMCCHELFVFLEKHLSVNKIISSRPPFQYDVLHYLYITENQHVREYIIDQLSDWQNKHLEDAIDIEFFLPQISYLCLLPHFKSLLEYVLNKCSRCIHFSIKFYCYILSIIHYIHPNIQIIGEKILTDIEMAVVNSERWSAWQYLKHQFLNPLSNQNNLNSFEYNFFLSKQYRSEIFNSELEMIENLNNISQQLMNSEPQKRLNLLKIIIDKTQHFFINHFIPHFPGSNKHARILNVVNNESLILSSHTKVPFLLIFEVSYNDLTNNDPLLYLFDQTNIKKNNDKNEKNIKSKQLFVSNFETPTTSQSSFPILLDLVSSLSFTSQSSSYSNQSPSSSSVSTIFGEEWIQKKQRIYDSSKYNHHQNWSLVPFIFKSNDDSRQEFLVMQIVVLLDQIFQQAGLELEFIPYNIFVCGPKCSIIQYIPNTISVHQIKEACSGVSLRTFFLEYFHPSSNCALSFIQAQSNFVKSMAAYSLLVHLMQIRDRHNGNILLSSKGHIIHVDYGYILSNSPGGNMNFETSPFKLTQEYLEVMDGTDSLAFNNFKRLIILGLLEMKKHHHKIMLLIEIMAKFCIDLPCFQGGMEKIISGLKNRLCVDFSEKYCIEYAHELINQSINHLTSIQYDEYQRICNNIL